MSIISNSVQNNGGGASQEIRSQSRTYRSGNSTLHLREGQTLRGVVSDIHGNEITLSMEDGSSFTGKLPDANQYSIGQKAAFLITSLDDNTIYMKATTGAYLLDMEDTVAQALEEAGLPRSTRNLDVVRSLLANQQSISRENIMASIKLCAQYPDADVNSVITMRRLGMPMTETSVKQFENYQNQTHQLLYKMDSLGDSIAQMLQSIGSQIPRFAKEAGNQLLTLALEGNPTPEEQILTAQMADAASESLLPETDAEGNPLAAETASEEAAEDSQSAANLETASPLARMRQLFSAITDGNAAARSAMSEAGMTEDFRTPFIHEQTGFILSPEERTSFSEQLKEFPLSEEVKAGLADGSVTAREFLTEIKQAFPHMTDEQAGALLTSKAFQKIVKGQFLSNWTISPEHLKKEGALEEVYEKMSKQFDALSHFSETVLGKDVFKQLSNTASDMNDNLNFMKTLNETFQYVQLPLKLQNQNTHGDLYVMTRKEALKKDPKDLKVLLHLDMDHLGTLDIQIARENTAVSLNFYVSTEETRHLLNRNMELLNDAINQQGYACTSELSMKEKDVDIVNDFIAQETPVGDMKRYNFDLRA
ncbi:MAG: flagellar hook-length control protein FliK [Eubacterium sp.]|nr:flagellar hook-length control protein FliK [Eubacterium sp.]